MDLSFEVGAAFEPSKCSKLSMNEKRELVYQLSNWSGAPEILQSWSRQEILQILCVEMGKERKYTGLTKLKIIEHLLKIVAGKKSVGCEATTDLGTDSSPASSQRAPKRQRKIDNPSRVPIPANTQASITTGSALGSTMYCRNSACRAIMRQDDTFCKRCSCCICYQYDDNKDPSLWLTCSSEPQFQGLACGLSCHLDCASKHKSSGIGKSGQNERLDGSFFCVACGKVNDLLGCWRKQLILAKDTRRVDILCYRLSLSQKLLSGTRKYQKHYNIITEAVNKLESEVGPLTGLPVKMGRGIVNRLSSGQEVQKLCAFALESLNQTFLNNALPSSCDPLTKELNFTSPISVSFENVSPTSVAGVLGSEYPSADAVVGYTLWHRNACDVNYLAEPTCRLLVPNARFVVAGLSPATEYLLKIVSFSHNREVGMREIRFSTGRSLDNVPNSSVTERSQSPATNCSSLSNPSSVQDETNHNTGFGDQIVNREDNYHSRCREGDKVVSASLSNGAMNCSGSDEEVPGSEVPLLDEDRAMQVVCSIPNSDMEKIVDGHSQEEKIVEEISTDDGSDRDTPNQVGTKDVPSAGGSEASLPVTPCKLEILDVQGRNARPKPSNKDVLNGNGKGEEPRNGSTSKKRVGERQEEECTADGLSDRDFEYYVKVIRWLECEGHIDKNFRQKFLTWYSLRASQQEMRIVKAFVDTFIEDPASLAEQLLDTFSECVSNRTASVVPAGFCMKLWH